MVRQILAEALLYAHDLETLREHIRTALTTLEGDDERAAAALRATVAAPNHVAISRFAIELFEPAGPRAEPLLMVERLSRRELELVRDAVALQARRLGVPTE